MEEETLEQKQKYLRENVLEKGYDPDKFMEFLTMKKGESGIDLENWTLKELIDVTNEFLSNNKLEIESNLSEKKEIKEEEIDEKEIEKEKEKGEMNQQEENKENEDIQDKKEQKNNSDENNVKCKIVEKTEISKQDKIQIKVLNPTVEKAGIFSFSYSSYLIDTSPLKLQVKRKFADFLWLYNILKSQFVNCIVPPFFKKKDKLDKMTQRVYFIQKFLNGIAIHPILKNSKIFYDFISIKDEKEFNKKKNEYSKLQNPSSISKIKTLNGVLKASFTDQQEVYFENIKSKLNSQEAIYNKLLEHYKSLLLNIIQTSQEMKEISKIWEELFCLKNQYFETECIEGVYNSHLKIIEKWSKLQTSHAALISYSIRKFYRFIKEEYNCFKDLSLTVDNYKYNYYKKKNKINNARENYLIQIEKNENRMKEQGIAFEKKSADDKEIEFINLNKNEINKLEEMKKEYGCYLNCYINEYERLRDLNNIRFKENLFGFIKDLTSQFSNYSFNLSEILSFLDSLP